MKRNNWPLYCLLSSALWVGESIAQDLKPQDFAFGARFSEGRSSLLQAVLPDTALEHIQQRNFADVRVFNADGASVPFEINHDVSVKQQKKKRWEKALNFFPLAKNTDTGLANIRLELQQDRQTQRLQMHSDTGMQTTASDRPLIEQYIIRNAAEKDGFLCQLEFEWQQNPDNRLLPFRLETSGDLKQWHMLVSKLSISHLQHEGQNLENKQVNIPCTQANYLRLAWAQPQPDIAITHVKGVYVKQLTPTKTVHWKNVKPTLTQNKGVAEFHFANPGIMPIQHIRLIPSTAGNIYVGRVYSRQKNSPGHKAHWRYRGDLNQYLIDQGATRIQSEANTVTTSRDPLWKIRLETTGSSLPEISLGWHPDTILFLAQGSPPFTLAYGNPTLNEAAQYQLLNALGRLQDREIKPQQVTLGPARPLGDVSLNPKPFAWRSIVLWLVLVIGIFFMACMAYSLRRQMNHRP